MPKFKFFHLFELPILYYIDVNRLRSKYFELAKQLHPDYFSQNTEAEQAQKINESAELNLAFKTLSSDKLRLEYLLQCFDFLGASLENQTEIQPSPSFLTEMLELNEELIDASEENIHSLQQKISALEQEKEKEIQKILLAFDQAKEIQNKGDELKKVIQPYLELKYILRAKENLSMFASS
jgi:molecular chaperone HscB